MRERSAAINDGQLPAGASSALPTSCRGCRGQGSVGSGSQYSVRHPMVSTFHIVSHAQPLVSSSRTRTIHSVQNSTQFPSALGTSVPSPVSVVRTGAQTSSSPRLARSRSPMQLARSLSPSTLGRSQEISRASYGSPLPSNVSTNAPSPLLPNRYAHSSVQPARSSSPSLRVNDSAPTPMVPCISNPVPHWCPTPAATVNLASLARSLSPVRSQLRYTQMARQGAYTQSATSRSSACPTSPQKSSGLRQVASVIAPNRCSPSSVMKDAISSTVTEKSCVVSTQMYLAESSAIQ